MAQKKWITYFRKDPIIGGVFEGLDAWMPETEARPEIVQKSGVAGEMWRWYYIAVMSCPDKDGYFYVIGGVESEKNRRSETRKGPSAAISQS